VLLQFIKDNGTTFEFTTEIFNTCNTAINALPDASIKNIKADLLQRKKIKIDADVKAILRKALKEFYDIMCKEITDNITITTNSLNIFPSALTRLENLITHQIHYNSTADGEIAIHDINQLKNLWQENMLPIMNLRDNNSDLARAWCTTYFAIQKLGETFGFTARSIRRGWSGWAKKHWVKIGLGIGGAIGAYYLYSKFNSGPIVPVPSISPPEPVPSYRWPQFGFKTDIKQ
jgi:hypothetical protein